MTIQGVTISNRYECFIFTDLSAVRKKYLVTGKVKSTGV